MSEQSEARAALMTALKEVIRECSRGGPARAGVFAPQIVAINNAISAIDSYGEPPPVVDRMAVVRAAKKPQQ